MQKLKNAFRDFYTSYDLLNKLCWNNFLPPCQLGFSKRMHRAWAIAQSDYRIRFNAPLCAQTTDVHILMIMAHEMTHIHQYCTGIPAGHSQNFYAEMERIGISGKTVMSAKEQSAFSYAIFMYCLKNIKLSQSIRLINSSNVDKITEIKMFNQMKEEFLCR